MRADPAVVLELSAGDPVSLAAWVVVVGWLGGTIMVGTFEAMTAVDGITRVVSGVTVNDWPVV